MNIESNRAKGNCILPYIFYSFVLSCFFFDFVINNHGCLGVMQSLQYKILVKLFWETETKRKRYRPEKRSEHYNMSKEWNYTRHSYLLLQNRPPSKPPDKLIKRQDVDDLKTNIEENLSFQENIISKIFERPDKSYFQEPVELKDLVDTKNTIQRFLPKQTDIDKILEIIRKKVLKGTHLPLPIKEIQAGYLNSLYFKDIYLYLAQNRLPSKKVAIKRMEILAEKYIILDSLLFKLTTIPGKETALLANPEMCADKIITLYHSNLFAGHQGVINTYLMISDRFFIPNLMHYLRSYIKGCHICPLNRKDKLPERQLQPRINLNYRPLSRLSMDLKVMPRSSRGDRYILCVIDEVTNYIIIAPIKQSKSKEVGEDLINNVFF